MDNILTDKTEFTKLYYMYNIKVLGGIGSFKNPISEYFYYNDIKYTTFYE